MELAGQRVVVIGGTSGMGLDIAAAAAAAGASVVVASRTQDKIDKALTRLPDGSAGHRLDAADHAAVAAFFERVGEFDHLVFTAGEHIVFKPLADVSVQEAKDWFDDRFWMVFSAAKHAAGHLRGGGSITLTTGIVPIRPVPGTVVHAVAAGAIDTLVKALAVELGPIRVNAVRVGPRETSLHDDPERIELFQAIMARLPVRRFGSADEVTDAYLHLMRSGYTTGSVLQLDGGYVLV